MKIAIVIFSVSVILICLNVIGNYRWKEKHPGDPVTAQDPFYKGGHFYFNLKDIRILVQKRKGGGYTFNFGNPLTYLIIFSAGLSIYLFS